LSSDEPLQIEWVTRRQHGVAERMIDGGENVESMTGQ
jgi:hypothetical protein